MYKHCGRESSPKRRDLNRAVMTDRYFARRSLNHLPGSPLLRLHTSSRISILAMAPGNLSLRRSSTTDDTSRLTPITGGRVYTGRTTCYLTHSRYYCACIDSSYSGLVTRLNWLSSYRLLTHQSLRLFKYQLHKCLRGGTRAFALTLHQVPLPFQRETLYIQHAQLA